MDTELMVDRVIRESSAMSSSQLCLFSPQSGSEQLSRWTRSRAKRAFDLVVVLALLPALVPLSLLIAAAIRLTSRGPVLFSQVRIGKNRKPFTILKFRTMISASQQSNHPITTIQNRGITSIGRVLRWCKLDELPQCLNVLRADMSLVGPRPKVPEHQIADLECRPGITGAATIAFAREERFLANIPEDQLKAWYYEIVLPFKLRIDADYMARATVFSDLQLLLRTALRRWDDSAVRELAVLMKADSDESMKVTEVAAALKAGVAADQRGSDRTAFSHVSL